LLQTKEKYADGLSVAIHPSATRLCSQEESCLKRSCPASIFTQYAAKFAEKARVDAYGNTAQRASDDFARHLLANFPSSFTKMLVNTSSIHSAFCFI
jgi:hypothetical protein